MKEHTLKTVATVWDAVNAGEKTFEVRRNDRFFQRGDIVILRKLSSDNSYYERDYTAKSSFATCDLKFKIGWILQGGQFGLEPGYIAFQLESVDVGSPK
jgi:hypothetical protein